MESTQGAYSALSGRMKRILLAWRLTNALRGFFLAMGMFCAPVAAGIAVGADGMVRAALLALAAAPAAVLLLVCALWPLVRPLGLLDAAFLAERRMPEFGGRLAAAVELDPGQALPRVRRDPRMVASLVSDAAGAAGRMPVFGIVDTRPMLFSAGILMAVLILSAAGVFISRSTPGDIAGFLSPPYLPERQHFELVRVTGDIKAPVGGKAVVEVLARGNFSEKPYLELEMEGLDPFVLELEKSAAPGETAGGERFYRAQIDSVAGDMLYRVAWRDYRSGGYHVFAIEPPHISSIGLRLLYPDHTGLIPDEREGGGDLRVPYGTKVHFNVQSSSDLEGASIVPAGGDETPLSVIGKTATGTVTVREDIRYSIHLQDTHGFSNRFPPEYLIESVPDAKPKIKLLYPGEDLTLSRVSTVKLRGSAGDDYMVASVRLHVQVVGSEEEPSVQKIPIQQGREVLFEFPWDLSMIEAYEGDVIEYRLSATDNDRLTGPKTVFSSTRRIHLLSRFEDYRESRDEQEEIISRMESAMREGEKIRERFRDLAMSVDTSPKGSRQWKAEAERALERQQSLENELNEISGSMKESISRMQNNELVNLDTLKKMGEIDRLMDEIMTDEMRKLIEQIRQNLENTDLGKIDKKLLDSMRDQEKILNSLDQTLQRLKWIRAEQELEALREQMERLTGRQESLLERTEKLDEATGGKKPEGKQLHEASRQAREEEKIRDELEATMDSMEQLAGTIEDISIASSEELKRLSAMGRKEKAPANMGRAAQELREGSVGESARKEKEALSTMQKMSDGMSRLAESHKSQADEMVKKMVRDLLRRTLDISESHEKSLMIVERLFGQQNPAFNAELVEDLVSEESIALEAADYLKRDAFRLAVMSMAIPPSVPDLATRAAEQLGGAVERLSEDDNSGALGFQRRAARTLNRLALALLEGQKRAGMPGGGKSAMESFMEQLQKMAGQQESLNAATKQLGSSGLPLPGMGEAMQRLAAQQRMISEGMGELAEEMQNMGEMGERMSQIEKEMEEIQEELSGGNAGREVQRRQSRVLRRLRDASLSLRKEVFEENRVAETAGEYEQEEPEKVRDLLEEALPEDIRRELEQLRTRPRPPGYERLIEKYYNELMRGAP